MNLNIFNNLNQNAPYIWRSEQNHIISKYRMNIMHRNNNFHFIINIARFHIMFYLGWLAVTQNFAPGLAAHSLLLVPLQSRNGVKAPVSWRACLSMHGHGGRSLSQSCLDSCWIAHSWHHLCALIGYSQFKGRMSLQMVRFWSLHVKQRRETVIIT